MERASKQVPQSHMQGRAELGLAPGSFSFSGHVLASPHRLAFRNDSDRTIRLDQRVMTDGNGVIGCFRKVQWPECWFKSLLHAWSMLPQPAGGMGAKYLPVCYSFLMPDIHSHLDSCLKCSHVTSSRVSHSIQRSHNISMYLTLRQPSLTSHHNLDPPSLTNSVNLTTGSVTYCETPSIPPFLFLLTP